MIAIMTGNPEVARIVFQAPGINFYETDNGNHSVLDYLQMEDVIPR
jgi:hypothetical protein